jgi:hypothetical protein
VTTIAPPVLTYRKLDNLAEQAWAAVLAVYLLREEMDEQEWRALLVAVLVFAILQGESWGRLYGEVALPVDGIGLVPADDKPRRPAPEDFDQRSERAPDPDDVIDFVARDRELTDRLDKALRTLGADQDRLERLTRDETIAATQRGYQDGVRISPSTTSSRIRGYRRQINPDACELCWWLWKEGYVYPIDQPMHRHIGCRCVPVPTTEPVGRWKLSASEERLLDDLYSKYVTEKKRNRNA